MTADVGRDHAAELDRIDPLRTFRDRVVIADPEILYLDGNSLGRMPVTTPGRLAEAAELGWGRGLIRSWPTWIEHQRAVGDLIGTQILGANRGEVAIGDSTSVNLYKLAAAALDARPDRHVILTDDDNFPTDRYVLAGLAEARGAAVRTLHTDLDRGIDPVDLRGQLTDDVALVSFSHVAYRSGALADLAGITAASHYVGALCLWDLSHSAGSVPVELRRADADLAVGCAYKYLCGGPGAPAYLYVRADLQDALQQPIWGWFGQRDQFAMGLDYSPAAGIASFGVGTPPVLATYAVEEGVRLVVEAGIPALHRKARALTTFLIDLAEDWLLPLGFRVATPHQPNRRGAHVTLQHPDAWRICQAVTDAGVIPDYRTPDRLRLGPAALYTGFTEVYDAMARIRDVVAAGRHESYPGELAAVT